MRQQRLFQVRTWLLQKPAVFQRREGAQQAAAFHTRWHASSSLKQQSRALSTRTAFARVKRQ